MVDTAEHFIARPGHLLGAYPELRPEPQGRVDEFVAGLAAPVAKNRRNRQSHAKRFLNEVNALGKDLKTMKAGKLAGNLKQVRAEMRQAGLRPDLVARAFALVREYAYRTLDMRPYDCQVLGCWAILEGMLAEMDTGEGKTLTATLPAAAAAFAGIPVHVITVNDYLAERDCELLSPLFAVLGLSASAVTSNVKRPDDRRAGYAADVVYCTNKQLVFDYLRDQVAIGERRDPLYRVLDKLKREPAGTGSGLLLRGLCFAIVDEADSVLVDEARTPLKLSAPTDSGLDEAIYQHVVEAVRDLDADTDFNVATAADEVSLTAAGEQRIESILDGKHDYFESRRRRNAIVCQALVACHCFKLDRDYLIRDGNVEIIDEHTGRAMPDRSWELGLHQLIEAKEGLEISKPARTIARITFQRFFRRYHRVGAMSGTAREVADELWSVYELPVFRVEPNKPSQRENLGIEVCSTEQDKWQAIIKRIRHYRSKSRPVLVGTRSLGASERLSEALSQAGIPHEVLNARNDREEAEIVARAGASRRVTVATNMAGRGTDIKLGPGVEDLGGLHVIVAECNDASRIDRQLHGRAGRQGQPGTSETVLAWSDDAFQNCGTVPARYVANRLALKKSAPGRRLDGRLVGWLQASIERRHARLRRALLRKDQRMDEVLAFTGRSE